MSSIIQRTAILWARRRSCLLPRRNISYNHPTRSSSSSSQFLLHEFHHDNNNRNIFIQRPTLHHHLDNISDLTIPMVQVRTMVMVTQTKSSEEEGDENSPTSQQKIANNENNIDDATTTSNSEDLGDIIITKSCAARIRQLASTRPNPDSVYLRLYVDAGGCSGFQYKFLLLSEDNASDDDEEEEDGTIDPEEDIVFVQDDMRVVVDATSLDLLRGSTIDYVQEMIRSSFAVVGNPQSESACGCGSSFAVKNFESNPALD